jgi:acetolactate synthase I/II/III large subunit
MASDYTVADLVAEFLAACRVSTAFGVASVHNLPMLDSVGRRNAIRFIMARGEMGAAHMADGYARAAGALGVVFSSTGPGAANAVGGLVEARFAGTPVLHIASQTISRFLDRRMGTVHDAYDQLTMLHSVSKSAYRVDSAQHAFGILTRAAVDALTPHRGPVSVEIPIDIQRTKIERPAGLDEFSLPLPPPRAPTKAELDELTRRVLAARRPLLWLGSGALQAGEAAHRLLDLGFVMVSSWLGRGTVPDEHPLNLSGLNGNGMPMIQEFYKTVDLALVVGSRLRGHEHGDFTVKLPEQLVQIDVDPMANGRTYPNSYFVCADAKLTLEALLERVDCKMKVAQGYQDEFRQLKRAALAEYLGQFGPYAGFMGQLRAAMPKDAIWVRDITQSTSTWGNRIFPIYSPRENVYPVSAGIGQGLPLGVGAAAAAQGRKTVLLTGDGGFYLNIGELWTAVQEQLDLVVIVMNDKGYGVIKKLQDQLQGGRKMYADMLGPDLQQLAAMTGMPFWKVAQADALGATVSEALRKPGPCLVEVDMTSIGEYPNYFPFNPRPNA